MTSSDADKARPAFPLKPEFATDLFAGTATYYAKYRDGYPDSMLDEILETAHASSGGTLLDLGCGTGQVAIPMARRFSQVWAVDQESEMIKVGAEEARRAGVDVRWTCSSAERLNVADGELEMFTIANAFHRLDRPAIARAAVQWLRAEGALVIMGSGRLPNDPRPQWQTLIQQTIREWRQTRPPASPTSDQSPPGQRTISHEQLLAEEGFHITQRSFSQTCERSLDEVIGHVYSRSYASRRSLGPGVDEFEAELRARLAEAEPTGRFIENIGYFYIVGRPNS